MPEFCETMMGKEELDEPFFDDDDDDDDDATIPAIAIFSYEPASPEDMELFAPDTRSLRTEN